MPREAYAQVRLSRDISVWRERDTFHWHSIAQTNHTYPLAMLFRYKIIRSTTFIHRGLTSGQPWFSVLLRISRNYEKANLRHFKQRCSNHVTMGITFYAFHIIIPRWYFKFNEEKIMQTSNENLFLKNRVIRTATKRKEKVSNLESNALTSLIHFVQLHNKMNHVGGHWLVYTFLLPSWLLCFVKNIFITCLSYSSYSRRIFFPF